MMHEFFQSGVVLHAYGIGWCISDTLSMIVHDHIVYQTLIIVKYETVLNSTSKI